MKAAAFLGWTAAVMGWGTVGWLLLERTSPPPPDRPPVLGTATERRTDAPASRPASDDQSGIGRIFREWSADPALAGALVGFCLLDSDGGVLYASPLASAALCPASALKTVTTAAALERLGPDFHFETVLTGTGTMNDAGVLDGSLRLVGSGDPTFATADIEEMVRQAAAAGLKKVNGPITVTTEADFDGPVNEHWNWGDIGNAYGAGAYRLNLDHNRISLRFNPGAKTGDPARLLNPDTATSDTRWVSEVLTGARGSGDQVKVFSEPRGRMIRLLGTVPLGENSFSVGAALPDPPARVKEILTARLKAAGIEVIGREIPLRPQGSRVRLDVVLARHQSAPISAIIPHLHRVSDNLEAQCLFFAIGTQADAEPAWIIRRHWEDRGVEFAGLRLIDGSGLARANMIRPLDLAQVNHLARRGPHGALFRESLSSYLGGKVRSKLGAMSGVKTDVGFITLADGRECTFALMANGLDLRLNFWPLREDLLERISQ